jgi:phosphomethylpyrimidine synthase
MKITEDVRKFAEENGLNDEAALEAGMQKKSAEFLEQGGEVYSASRLETSQTLA